MAAAQAAPAKVAAKKLDSISPEAAQEVVREALHLHDDVGEGPKKRPWRGPETFIVAAILVLVAIQQILSPEKDRVDYPFIVALIAFVPFILDLFHLIVRWCRPPTELQAEKERQDLLEHCEAKPDIHQIASELFFYGLCACYTVAWWKHLSITPKEEWPPTVSSMVSDLNTQWGMIFFFVVPLVGQLLYRSNWFTLRWGWGWGSLISASIQVGGFIHTIPNPETWGEAVRAKMHFYSAMPAFVITPALVVFNDPDVTAHHPKLKIFALSILIMCGGFVGVNMASIGQPWLPLIIEATATVMGALLTTWLPNPSKCESTLSKLQKQLKQARIESQKYLAHLRAQREAKKAAETKST